jgi:hypothetical protein
VARLVDHDGKPHFKYIVEGANLFITQQARLYLEKRRVVLFKDSSANKVSLHPESVSQVIDLMWVYRAVSPLPRSKYSLVLVSPIRNTSTS